MGVGWEGVFGGTPTCRQSSFMLDPVVVHDHCGNCENATTRETPSASILSRASSVSGCAYLTKVGISHHTHTQKSQLSQCENGVLLGTLRGGRCLVAAEPSSKGAMVRSSRVHELKVAKYDEGSGKFERHTRTGTQCMACEVPSPATACPAACTSPHPAARSTSGSATLRSVHTAPAP